MRRVALALFSTVTGLVMLLNFKTHSAPRPARPSSAPDQPSPAAIQPAATRRLGGSTGAGARRFGVRRFEFRRRAAPSTSVAPSSASTTKTVTGDSVDTR